MNPSEIKDWLEDLWKVLVDLNISINNAKRLTENKYEHEEKIKKHGFIQHHWYQLRFIIVIQLSKLIANKKNTHKRNFFYLCDKLESTDFNETFFQELNKLQPERYFEANTTEKSIREVIRRTREKLDYHSILIEKTISARNQTYAHNDPIPGKKVPVMKDLGTMVLLCNEIYNEISGELFKSHTGFEHTNNWDIDYILKEMSTRRTQFIEQINNKRKRI
ncbi:hypothetical protein [Roseivirga sp.]|uniref:hypothetical protein n=1 Tax=Roseivirga sp. TaxID=1964215 RepID=UPI002B27703F|nr:hypothetical protein [Roseivirga sp.]